MHKCLCGGELIKQEETRAVCSTCSMEWHLVSSFEEMVQDMLKNFFQQGKIVPSAIKEDQKKQWEAPPIGVMPLHLHLESNPQTVKEHLDRYLEVSAAVKRYREAGKEVPQEWLWELGV